MNLEIKNHNQSTIDLSNKNLREIPKEIFELKNLKKLILRNNKIKTIPSDIENLKRLETLDLSGNNISNFYAKICTLKNLKILNLNNNLVKSIPLQISNLKKLRSLHLSKNKLKIFPTHVYSLENLRELDISNNEIEIIEDKIENLHNLKKIWLNNQQITYFPIQSLSRLTNLSAIYCFSKNIIHDEILDKKFKELSLIKGNSINLFRSFISQYKISSIEESNHKKSNKKIKATRKIFVTYAWTDNSFNDKVISFVDFLRIKGFDATIDRKKTQEESSINLNKMMIEGIANSDKVIIVLNSVYKQKADNFKGGVNIEFQIIFEDLKFNNNKYIFVSFGTETLKEISPLAISGREILDLKKDQDENNFNTLFSKIKEETILNFSEIPEEEVQVRKVDIKPFEL